MKSAVYKTLPLLLVLNGCYTVILDTLRIREVPPEDIKIDKYYDGEEALPIVNRSIYNQYGSTRYPYAYLHNGYYYNDPYAYGQYGPTVDRTGVVLSREEYLRLKAAQAPKPMPPKVDATALAEKKRRQELVWKKRIEPRIRKAPTPTRRQKDGE